MDKLPNEIWAMILNSCDLYTWIRLRYTCSTLYYLPSKREIDQKAPHVFLIRGKSNGFKIFPLGMDLSQHVQNIVQDTIKELDIARPRIGQWFSCDSIEFNCMTVPPHKLGPYVIGQMYSMLKELQDCENPSALNCLLSIYLNAKTNKFVLMPKRTITNWRHVHHICDVRKPEQYSDIHRKQQYRDAYAVESEQLSKYMGRKVFQNPDGSAFTTNGLDQDVMRNNGGLRSIMDWQGQKNEGFYDMHYSDGVLRYMF